MQHPVQKIIKTIIGGMKWDMELEKYVGTQK